jgi:hypothetical protein
LPGLAWNHDPPNLSLCHNWDDRHMTTNPATNWDSVWRTLWPSWLESPK